jgi:Domain of unknown function (DUF4214)
MLFLQTGDPSFGPFIDQTSRTVREYCRRHRFNCQIFYGTIRGVYRWHATYNRVLLLRQLVDAGHRDWACYLDGDAYIVDLDFDVRAYLRDKADRALVIAQAEADAPWWNVNSGVFMINLGSPVGRRIVLGWSERLDAISDEELVRYKARSLERGDQRLLALTLKDMPELEDHVEIDRATPPVINYESGSFIRHQMRPYGSWQQRLKRVRADVAAVLGVAAAGTPGPEPAPQPDEAADLQEELARALYRVMLLREPDDEGLATWLRYIRSGAPLEEVMRAFLQCDEFSRMHPHFIAAHVGVPRR